MSAAGSGTTQEGHAQGRGRGRLVSEQVLLLAARFLLRGRGGHGSGSVAGQDGGPCSWRGGQQGRLLVALTRTRARVGAGSRYSAFSGGSSGARPRGGTSCGCCSWVGSPPRLGACPGEASACRSWAQGWPLSCEYSTVMLPSSLSSRAHPCPGLPSSWLAGGEGRLLLGDALQPQLRLELNLCS